MEEIWKDIAGYEGLYQVSNFGRVKSYRQSSKYGKKDEFILRGSLSNNGYLDVTLYKGPNERHKFLLHRLVASALVNNPNGYTCVNHKDEDSLTTMLIIWNGVPSHTITHTEQQKSGKPLQQERRLNNTR